MNSEAAPFAILVGLGFAVSIPGHYTNWSPGAMLFSNDLKMGILLNH
jgi:hypothetical protein